MVPVTFSRTIVALGLLFMGTADSFAGTTLERIKQTGVVNLGFREDSLTRMSDGGLALLQALARDSAAHP